MKKFMITGAIALGMLFSAGSANAQSTQELLDLIASLTAQLNAMQGSSSTSGSLLSDFDGVNLRVGVISPRVGELQACMNAAGYSTGVVDNNFGPNTKAGVMAFQASQGLVVDGIVGVQTNPAFQAACSTGGSSDDSSNDDSNDDTSVFDSNDGEEVNFTGLDIDDGADTTIDEGANKAELGEIEFQNEDSDVLLERFDVILATDSTAVTGDDERDAWKAFDTIYIYVDGDLVAEEDVDNKSDWDDRDLATANLNDDENRFRITGINAVLDKDEDHTVTIKADIASSVDIDGVGAPWVLVLDETTMRFVDEAGITQYLSEEDGNGETLANFNIVTEGNQDELQVSSSTEDPDSTTFEVKSGQESDEESVFFFDVEADEDGGDLEVSEITLTVDMTGGNFDAIVSEVTLEIAGESEDYDVAKSSNLGTASATLVFDFDGKEISIDAGDTEEAEVLMTFKSTNNQVAYTNGATVKVSATSANVDAWDVDGADTLTVAQLTGSAVGDAHQLSEEGVIATLDSSSITTTIDNNGEVKTATFTMNVDIEAFGDTFYVGKVAQTNATVTGQNALAFSVEDSADAAIANSSVSFALASSASVDGISFRIDEGETETLTLTATVEIAVGGTDTYTRIQLNEVGVWTDNALTAGAQSIALLPVEDFESALQLINNI